MHVVRERQQYDTRPWSSRVETTVSMLAYPSFDCTAAASNPAVLYRSIYRHHHGHTCQKTQTYLLVLARASMLQLYAFSVGNCENWQSCVTGETTVYDRKTTHFDILNCRECISICTCTGVEHGVDWQRNVLIVAVSVCSPPWPAEPCDESKLA